MKRMQAKLLKHTIMVYRWFLKGSLNVSNGCQKMCAILQLMETATFNHLPVEHWGEDGWFVVNLVWCDYATICQRLETRCHSLIFELWLFEIRFYCLTIRVGRGLRVSFSMKAGCMRYRHWCTLLLIFDCFACPELTLCDYYVLQRRSLAGGLSPNATTFLNLPTKPSVLCRRLPGAPWSSMRGDWWRSLCSPQPHIRYLSFCCIPSYQASTVASNFGWGYAVQRCSGPFKGFFSFFEDPQTFVPSLVFILPRPHPLLLSPRKIASYSLKLQWL